MATREELATRALQELRLIGEGQAASANEEAKAVETIDRLLSRLRQMRVYAHTNAHAFEDDVFEPLALLLAEDLAPRLAGRPKDRFTMNEQENTLRNIQKQPLARNEMRVDRGLLRPEREGFEG